MIRLLKLLITRDWHLHEWEPYGDPEEVFVGYHARFPYKKTQPMRCKHCGKTKEADTA